MQDFNKLSKAQLIALIKTLEEANDQERPGLVEYLTHELSIHREELEVQNTELREITHRLEHSRNRYASLFDFAPVGYVSFDVNGIVQEVNLTACQMLGVERLALMGRPFHLYLDLQDRFRFLNFVRETLSRGTENSGDFTLHSESGNPCEVQLNCIVVKDADLKKTLCWTTFIDITERKRAEKAVLLSKANLLAVFENTDDVIWSINTQYNIVTFNTAFNRLRKTIYNTGVDHNIFAPRPVNSSLYRWKHLYDRALEGERLRVEETYLLDGEERHYELSLNPIRSGEEIIGVSIHGTDITERKILHENLRVAKEKAEALSQYRSTVLSSLSHELRTPLNAMLSYSTLIKEVSARSDVQEYSDIIQRNGRRLVEMINHSLELAQLEAGKHAFHMVVIDPKEVVERQCTMLRSLAQEKGLYLKFEDTATGRIKVDLNSFDQILTNLIGNAAKFTEKGGITVTLDSTHTTLEISVTDTGIGISEAFLPHIFEEFKREPNELNNAKEGSGLGLSITRRLVELMGGSLTCASRRGHGTTFRVSFPLAETKANIISSSAPGNSKLLLVEDDMDQASGLMQLLHASWKIDHAFDGETALSLADRFHYRGVLLDMGLGDGIDGLEVTRRLRRTSEYARVPIIGITGDPATYSELAAVTSGCDALLIKPITPDKLEATLLALVA